MSTNTIKTRKRKQHPYYNFDKVFSFNAFFMFVVGGRGLGKTYGAKKKAINDALYNGRQFIYLRRFKSELIARNTFFADLMANGEFSDWDFRINGSMAQASGAEFRDDKKREWITLGYFIALSTAQTQKSIAYPDVTTIIFDEFIIEKGATHYLPDEAKAFKNFFSTVDRWQDKTRVLFLANAVTVNNPYFLEYRVRPNMDGSDELIKQPDPLTGEINVVVHIVNSKEFSKSVLGTRFGRFIADSDYADYAIGNEFSDNNDNLLHMKDGDASYLYTLQTRSGTFSLWHNGINGRLYAQERRPKQERIYVTEERFMREDTSLMLRNHPLLSRLRSSFSHGVLFFDSPQTRNAMIEVFR